MPPETEDRQQHRKLQKEYGSFYRAVSDILFRLNPMELDGKHNKGEYDPEIDALLSRIRETADSAALRELVFEIFRDNFGDDNCGAIERFDVVTAEIWKAWERHRAA